jgi:hypothetical protein
MPAISTIKKISQLKIGQNIMVRQGVKTIQLIVLA